MFGNGVLNKLNFLNTQYYLIHLWYVLPNIFDNFELCEIDSRLIFNRT